MELARWPAAPPIIFRVYKKKIKWSSKCEKLKILSISLRNKRKLCLAYLNLSTGLHTILVWLVDLGESLADSVMKIHFILFSVL